MNQGPGNPGADPYQTVAQMVPGQVILDRYSLRKVLGRGGFGVVWLVHDEQLDMDVAIKFLTDLIVSNPEAVEDLKRETRYSLRLTHPNIVRIYGFIQGSMVAGISMEYVDGGSLSALKVKQPNRCFRTEWIAPIVEKLCDALQYAHTKVKIAHRDLKPGNLMVDSGGDLKVADFGISRSISDTHTALTRAASTSGTPAFMSPQQMMGQPASVSDDIYSLGATLFDLLAGKPPFYSGDVAAQVARVDAPTIAQRRADLGIEEEPVPPEWDETIHACLAKEAKDRPRDAAEVAERLGLRVPAKSVYVSDPGVSATVVGGDEFDNERPPDARIATPRSGSSLQSRRPVTESGRAGTAPGVGRSNAVKIWASVGAVVLAAVFYFGIRGMSGGSGGAGESADAADVRGGGNAASSGTEGSAPASDGANTVSQGSDRAGSVDRADGSDPRASESGSDVGPSRGAPADAIPAAGDEISGESIQGESIEDGPVAEAEWDRSDPSGSDDSRSGDEASATSPDGSGPSGDPSRAVSNEESQPAAGDAAVANQRVPVLLGQAQSSLGMGDLGSARRQVDEALRLRPEDPQATRLLQEIEDTERAREAARQIASLESRIPGALRDGNVAGAQRDIDTLARLDPNHPSLSGWRARVSDLEQEAARAAAAEETASEKAAILSLVDRYKQAMESVDINLYERLWISLPERRKEGMKRAFESMNRQSLTLGTPSFDLEGETATVVFDQRIRSEMKAGSPVEAESICRMHLLKSDGTWKIESIESG